jgi:erythromycin esterase-like protein
VRTRDAFRIFGEPLMSRAIAQDDASVATRVREKVIPWIGDAASDCAPALDLIGDARVILLGEASHGTHEFYATRARITQRLIETGRCHAVAVEADWPDAYRVNRFVLGRSQDSTPEKALGDFKRFPQWMWRNRDVVEFVTWLHKFNQGRAPTQRIGFYGLDLYSMYASIEAVVGYLDKIDPVAARKARSRYACFDQHNEDSQSYGIAASVGVQCEEEAIAQLVDLRAHRAGYLSRDGLLAQDEQFFAEQNAHLVKNAERYYRGMFSGRVNTWNLRDRHMAETLGALLNHLGARWKPARVVVWAHNSHLGDARATEMAERGELNLGQLAREKYGADTFNLGFTTCEGTVSAAPDWGESVERKRVLPALPESIEAVMHETGLPDFLLNLRDAAMRESLDAARLQRAIGVIYRPESERHSHYFFARVSAQFDALIHRDRTRALVPLERTPAWRVPAEDEETFPTGI